MQVVHRAASSQRRERWIREGEEVAFTCPRVRRAHTPSPQVIYRKPILVYQHKQREENLLISSSDFVYEHINRGGGRDNRIIFQIIVFLATKPSTIWKIEAISLNP